jgi:flagellar motor switch/type III secretory pathway protein FliN
VATTPQSRIEEQLPAESAAGSPSGPTALARTEAPEPPRSIVDDPAIRAIPVQVDVAVPVRNFRVRNVLALAPGTVIESRWSHSEDLPLAAGDVQLAWCEFEVIETQLGVRITRLA